MAVRRTTQTGPIEVDPMFYIPEGVIDFKYVEKDEDTGDDAEDSGGATVISPTPTPDSPTVVKPPKKDATTKKPSEKDKKKDTKPKPGDKDRMEKVIPDVAVPKGLKVVEQHIHTHPDGSQTVDVVLEVDKVAGADYYELRVTRRDNGKTTVIG